MTGNGARIAVVCTITPASSQAEETHNTLKFALRAKKIEIHAERNEIMDQSSLIARYQQVLHGSHGMLACRLYFSKSVLVLSALYLCLCFALLCF